MLGGKFGGGGGLGATSLFLLRLRTLDSRSASRTSWPPPWRSGRNLRDHPSNPCLDLAPTVDLTTCSSCVALFHWAGNSEQALTRQRGEARRRAISGLAPRSSETPRSNGFSDTAEDAAVRAIAGEIPSPAIYPIARPGLLPLGHVLTRPELT